MFSAMNEARVLKRRPRELCFCKSRKVEPILYSLSGFQQMWVTIGKCRESWPTMILRDPMSVRCNSSKTPTNDEIMLTMAMVIGKVEPSAKKAAAWTDEECKSVVKAHQESSCLDRRRVPICRESAVQENNARECVCDQLGGLKRCLGVTESCLAMRLAERKS